MELEIILATHTAADVYARFQPSEALNSLVHKLVQDGMIVVETGQPTPGFAHMPRMQLTGRGTAYLEKVLRTPFPVARTVWEFPEESTENGN